MAGFFGRTSAEVEKTYIKLQRGDVEVAERPAAAPKLKPRREVSALDDDKLREYREVAEAVGVSAADLVVEEFRNFLAKKDYPTFNLQEVVKYMDDLTAKDNPTGLGWHWCPVRAKDAATPMTFGRMSVQSYHGSFGNKTQTTPASDFYQSHRFDEWHMHGQALFHQSASNSPPRPVDWRTMPSPVYTRTIPLHALKKIAAIEKEFTLAPVVFLVTDYTVAPHVIVNPDPFLMAVIPNSAVAHGKGRFIIDVWDEPGFGLDKMLKV